MVLPVLPLVAGGITAAAYLDAKYFISRDVSKGVALAGAGRTYVSLAMLLLPTAHPCRAPRFCSLKKNDKQDRNSIYYYFENSLLSRKDAECLVCEDVALSWVQVSQRQ